MAESSEYRPQGEGAHPTLAGNMLDPNVQADGALNQGQGVGGTSEQHVREEGLEHIKHNTSGLSEGTAPTNTSNTSTSSPSSSLPKPQPPASNPGADDPSGGISGGSGGISSASHVHSPVAGEEATPASGGIMGTVKSYLGLGGQSGAAATGSGTSEPVEARNAEGYGETLPSASGASGVADENVPPRSTESYDTSATGTSGLGQDTAAGALGGAAGGAPGERTLNKGVGTDPAAQQEAPRTQPTDSDVTTGAAPTESADPTTSNTAVPESEQTSGNDDPPVGSPVSEHTKKMSDKETGSKRENKEAIPTAGGEKLGEKHWGESQVVPDNPKPRASEAGISSEEGQPTSQVRDNTAANTGGAAPPAGGNASNDQGKEKLVDKIKDKLHIGHKDKS